ncbi:MAG: RHS repeat-associated core domain-containing protein [Opitutales bacterium]
MVANDGTTVESRYDYDPWGETTKTAGTGAESDFLYTGHFHHAGSGLYLAQYRAYDSELGRWLSRDPLGFVDGPNVYAYVGNNPLNRIDPDGRFWVQAGAGLAGGLFNAAYEGLTGGDPVQGFVSGFVGGVVMATTFNPALARSTMAIATGVSGAAGGMAEALVDELFDAFDGDDSTDPCASSVLESGFWGGLTGGFLGKFLDRFGDVLRDMPVEQVMLHLNQMIFQNVADDNVDLIDEKRESEPRRRSQRRRGGRHRYH